MKRIAPLFCLALLTAPLIAAPAQAADGLLGLSVKLALDAGSGGGFEQRWKQRDDGDDRKDDRRDDRRDDRKDRQVYGSERRQGDGGLQDYIRQVQRETGAEYIGSEPLPGGGLLLKFKSGPNIFTRVFRGG